MRNCGRETRAPILSSGDRLFRRGGVYNYKFAERMAPKPAVVVSNDGRNGSRFPYVHVVRVSDSWTDEQLPSIVILPDGECVTGSVRCDDLLPVLKEDLGPFRGSLSPSAMRMVEVGLKSVLEL